MTIQRAYRHAQAKAAITGETYFVVFDPADGAEDGLSPSQSYYVSDQAELDTYWSGTDVVHAVEAR